MYNSVGVQNTVAGHHPISGALMHAYVINNRHARAWATHDRKRPDLLRATAAAENFLGHSAKMRASGRILVAVCAIASLSVCNAAVADHVSSVSSTRAKRGVVPGNAASRPKGIRYSDALEENVMQGRFLGRAFQYFFTLAIRTCANNYPVVS